MTLERGDLSRGQNAEPRSGQSGEIEFRRLVIWLPDRRLIISSIWRLTARRAAGIGSRFHDSMDEHTMTS
jgi:hypothetical protein